jgi:hypothetical protein
MVVVALVESVRQPWNCHDLGECPRKGLEQPSLPCRLWMRNGWNKEGDLLRLLDKWAKGAFVSLERLSRMFTVIELAQFACKDVGPSDSQRSSHPCERRRGMGGVS